MTWYAIYCEPQNEFALAGRYGKTNEWIEGTLEKRGFEAFLPLEKKFRLARAKGKNGKRMKTISYPMFCGYVFVKFPAHSIEWVHVLDVPGVIDLVRFADDGSGIRWPAPIEDEQIEELRKNQDFAIPHRKSVNPHKSIRTGEQARIVSGAYAGHLVQIESIEGDKAEHFLELFGARRKTKTPIANLEAA